MDMTEPWETCTVGLCTGLFAAAAVASAPSLSALVSIAVEVVLIAFRTGSHVAAVADRLGNGKGSMNSWTYVIPGASESGTRSIIEKYNDSKVSIFRTEFCKSMLINSEKHIPSPAQAYISAITASSIAVSGPPVTLHALFDHEHVSDKTPMAIPVYGPYHASHLHAKVDFDNILRYSNPEATKIIVSSRPRSSVMSTTTGACYTQETIEKLLKAVVYDVLNEPLQFQKLLHGCVVKSKAYTGPKCLIIPFGPTHTAKALATVLKAQTDLEIVIRNSFLPRATSQSGNDGNDGTLGRGKLAIVGMAGRFPDAANHEKLWELLEKGLDVHRQVCFWHFNAILMLLLTPGPGSSR